MTDLFVPHQESLELKELGFDEPCFGSWETEHTKVPTYTHSNSQFYKNSNHPVGKVTTPTFSQAFKFFREKYKLHSRVDIQDVELDWYDYEILEVREGDYNNDLHKDTNFKSYEEAELACLRKLIELAKTKNYGI